MTRASVIRIASLAFFVALLAGMGCKQPEVSTMGSAVETGGVEFDLVDYELRLLELEQDGETIEYSDPVLAVEVELKNTGEEALNYSPSHDSQQTSEASTPLLYKDPGGEAELPPATKELVEGVYLEEGKLDEQVTETKTIESGDTLKDVFLFEEPDVEKGSFILSFPPSMHRGEMPVLMRFDYERNEPEGPKLHEIGEAIERDGVTFTVDEPEAKYVEIDDEDDGEGYSSDPLFVVPFTIENGGEEAISYEPDHRNVDGERAASLFSGDEVLPRAQLPSSATPKDRVEEATDIEPDDSLDDYVLFELPPEDAESLTFEYPARRFEGAGILRVEIPYEHDEPDKPEELAEAEDDDDDG